MFLAQNEVLIVHTHVLVSSFRQGSYGEIKSPGNGDTYYMISQVKQKSLEAMPTWAEACIGISYSLLI